MSHQSHKPYNAISNPPENLTSHKQHNTSESAVLSSHADALKQLRTAGTTSLPDHQAGGSHRSNDSQPRNHPASVT